MTEKITLEEIIASLGWEIDSTYWVNDSEKKDDSKQFILNGLAFCLREKAQELSDMADIIESKRLDK